MKLNLVVILGLVTLIALCQARPAEEEYNDYEEGAEPAPAPPPKKVPARPLVGRRNPITSRNSKTTTTTTQAPEKEDPEAAEGDYEDEQPEQASSTTEAPKKNFIKGGIVRPFRSNDDLLATLKRRREQAANNKHLKPVQSEAEEAAPAPVHNEATPKSSRTSNGRKRFNGTRDNVKHSEPAAEEPAPSPAAPARTGRRFHSRS